MKCVQGLVSTGSNISYTGFHLYKSQSELRKSPKNIETSTITHDSLTNRTILPGSEVPSLHLESKHLLFPAYPIT